MLCLAMTAFVKSAFHHLAGYVRILGGNIHRTGYTAAGALPEAGAACISGMARPASFHFNIVLTAATLSVIQTAGYSTV